MKSLTDIQRIERCLPHWYQNKIQLIKNYKTSKKIIYLIHNLKINSSHCALCRKYNNNTTIACIFCPIFLKTKVTFCDATPYREVSDWYNDCKNRYNDCKNRVYANQHGILAQIYKKGLKAITAEIKFLESLLKKWKKNYGDNKRQTNRLKIM